MSGGLDSSSIAIALKENNYHDVRTYSANFHHISNNEDLDETKYQKMLLNTLLLITHKLKWKENQLLAQSKNLLKN